MIVRIWGVKTLAVAAHLAALLILTRTTPWNLSPLVVLYVPPHIFLTGWDCKNDFLVFCQALFFEADRLPVWADQRRDSGRSHALLVSPCPAASCRFPLLPAAGTQRCFDTVMMMALPWLLTVWKTDLFIRTGPALGCPYICRGKTIVSVATRKLACEVQKQLQIGSFVFHSVEMRGGFYGEASSAEPGFLCGSWLEKNSRRRSQTRLSTLFVDTGSLLQTHFYASLWLFLRVSVMVNWWQRSDMSKTKVVFTALCFTLATQFQQELECNAVNMLI